MSKMQCPSLASQLPSYLIIPTWRPHEVKLRLQAGNLLFPAWELGPTDPTISQGTATLGIGLTWTHCWNLDKKRNGRQNYPFPHRGSKQYYCITYKGCCYAWNQTQLWDSAAEAEMVCVYPSASGNQHGLGQHIQAGAAGEGNQVFKNFK